MYRRRETELAWLRGMEVTLHPLKAGAYAELESAMIRWRTTELAGRKGDGAKVSIQGGRRE